MKFFDGPITMEDPELAKIRRGVAKDYEIGGGSPPNSARAILEAEQDNLEVVFPAANQLQLDIDDDRAFDIYCELLPIVDRYYSVSTVTVNPSRSGLPKRHVTITLNTEVTNFERIALQLALGSDRVREILGVIQERQGDKHPTLFLEKKATPTPIEEQVSDPAGLLNGMEIGDVI